MNDREYVESKWADGLDASDESIFIFVGDAGINLKSWADAAEFTRNREKQIAEKKEEIAVIAADASESWECGPAQTVYLRILASLEAILADLQRGMKEVI